MNAAKLPNNLIYCATDLKQTEVHSFLNGNAAIFTARSPEKETVNEDALGLLPYNDVSGVLIVADGLGGERAGKDASRIAIDSMHLTIRRAAEEHTPLREAILDGIEQANLAIMELGLGAATTLAAIEIQDNMIRPYHVGDSMILLTGQRGKTKFQAIPHSPVGYALESGMLNEMEAVVHEERHIVSNFIGTPEMRIDIGPTIKLAKRDTIIIASDGLSDNLYTDEIQGFIRKGTLKKASSMLLDVCQKRMKKIEEGIPHKPDDLSFIIFRSG